MINCVVNNSFLPVLLIFACPLNNGLEQVKCMGAPEGQPCTRCLRDQIGCVFSAKGKPGPKGRKPPYDCPDGVEGAQAEVIPGVLAGVHPAFLGGVPEDFLEDVPASSPGGVDSEGTNPGGTDSRGIGLGSVEPVNVNAGSAESESHDARQHVPEQSLLKPKLEEVERGDLDVKDLMKRVEKVR